MAARRSADRVRARLGCPLGAHATVERSKMGHSASSPPRSLLACPPAHELRLPLLHGQAQGGMLDCARPRSATARGSLSLLRTAVPASLVQATSPAYPAALELFHHVTHRSACARARPGAPAQAISTSLTPVLLLPTAHPASPPTLACPARGQLDALQQGRPPSFFVHTSS